MESQTGARTTLVDPFGRELEEWLRDAPATHAPYVADLVVPPVTGPVPQPGAEAFRRERGRHASVCAPAFPEPPERFALRFEQLSVEVSAASGRTVIERIVFLETEVRRRESDLARLAAWESEVADVVDPELDGAREYARAAFADIIADAAAETALLERRAARRAARAGSMRQDVIATDPERAELVRLIAATRDGGARADRDETTDETGPARPEQGLQAGFAPVSATTRPTPLVQPALGPTAADSAAVAAAVRAATGEQPIVTVATPAASAVPVAPAVEEERPAAESDTTDGAAAAPATARPGWWQRVVAELLRMLGRR